MLQMKVVGRTAQQLFDLANPKVANQPEAVPWVLYDTLTYLSAATVRLAFFQQVVADQTLSNMESQGSLPDPQYFEIGNFGLDVLRAPTSSADPGLVGALDDVQRLILTSRPTFQFVQSQKILGPFPASFLHGSGGVTGFGYGVDNVAAGGTPTAVQVANNGIFDGGFPVGGSVIIQPKVGFRITMDWPAAVTLTADVALRFWMAGVLYRRVN